jgi:glucosamine--fructose-6-phosphate aminotransferase (isomerizing)
LQQYKNVLCDITPEPYAHWTLKEIYEQPSTVLNVMKNRIIDNKIVLTGLDSKMLTNIDNIILLGCGSSYFAGEYGVHFFKELCCFNTVQIFDGAEFHEQDIPYYGTTAFILVSQSGETKDLHRCIEIGRKHDCLLIGVVNGVDSLIDREVDCGCYLNAGREVGVASTKSFTSQCVVLTLIAVWFSQSKGTCLEKRRKIISDLRNLSWQIDKVLDCWDQVKTLGSQLDMGKSSFVLGKGSDEAIAKESALKLKEIAYTHAEGFGSSAQKHGPFALITPGLPIFILDTNPESHDKNLNAFQEVKARDARVVLIGSGDSCELKTDYSKTFGGVLANIYLQILSFELGLKSGTNPDYPRNLAKVVTVE